MARIASTVLVAVLAATTLTGAARVPADTVSPSYVGCVLGADRPVHLPGTIGAGTVAGIGEQTCIAPFRVKIRVGLQQKKVNTFWPDDWITVYWAAWTPWGWGEHVEESAATRCATKRLTDWRVIVYGKMINENGVKKVGGDYSLGHLIRCRVPYEFAGSGW